MHTIIGDMQDLLEQLTGLPKQLVDKVEALIQQILSDCNCLVPVTSYALALLQNAARVHLHTRLPLEGQAGVACCPDGGSSSAPAADYDVFYTGLMKAYLKPVLIDALTAMEVSRIDWAQYKCILIKATCTTMFSPSQPCLSTRPTTCLHNK